MHLDSGVLLGFRIVDYFYLLAIDLQVGLDYFYLRAIEPGPLTAGGLRGGNGLIFTSVGKGWEGSTWAVLSIRDGDGDGVVNEKKASRNASVEGTSRWSR